MKMGELLKSIISLAVIASSSVAALEFQHPTTIFLTRHGQTDWNVEKRWQGVTDVPLNLTGIAEALEKSHTYSTYPVTAVYSSPLQRAYLTAQVIASIHGHRVRILDGLTEPSDGVLEGMPEDQVMQLIGPRLKGMNQKQRRHSGFLDGLVTPATTAMKAEEALSSIGDAHPGEVVVAVAHSDIMKPLLVMHTDAIYETIEMTNMAYLKFSYDGENLNIEEISGDITYDAYPVEQREGCDDSPRYIKSRPYDCFK